MVIESLVKRGVLAEAALEDSTPTRAAGVVPPLCQSFLYSSQETPDEKSFSLVDLEKVKFEYQLKMAEMQIEQMKMQAEKKEQEERKAGAAWNAGREGREGRKVDAALNAGRKWRKREERQVEREEEETQIQLEQELNLEELQIKELTLQNDYQFRQQ